MSSNSYDIGFLGDVFLGGEFSGNTDSKPKRNSNPFEGIKEILDSCDNLCVNFEGCVIKGKEPRPDKSSILHVPAEQLSILSDVGVNLLNLGNNHIWDYQDEGLIGTIDHLRGEGFQCFGAGRNIFEARHPVVLELEDATKVGLLSYTTDEIHTRAKIANRKSPGCAAIRIRDIREDIAALKQSGICSIVQLHTGFEYHSLPSPEEVAEARAIVDAGASMVIRHHAHVLQPWELYKGKLILYSLSNCFFPRFQYKQGHWNSWPSNSNVSCMVRCSFSNGSVSALDVSYLAQRSDLSIVPVSRGKALVLNVKNALASFLIRLSWSHRIWSRYHAWVVRAGPPRSGYSYTLSRMLFSLPFEILGHIRATVTTSILRRTLEKFRRQ